MGKALFLLAVEGRELFQTLEPMTEEDKYSLSHKWIWD